MWRVWTDLTPYLAYLPTNSVDCRELPREILKSHKNERDDYYSDKKKTHTLKSQVAVDEDTGAIVDVSDSAAGPTADIKLLEASGVM